MSEEKGHRGKNFTEKEKELAINVIKRYQSIIENKATDGGTMKIRKDTWQVIAEEFSAVAVSAPRNAQQLKILWANLRRQAKKTVAEENKRKYNEITDEEDIEDEGVDVLKKQKINDKKNSSKTGGGPYTPELTEVGARVLAMVEPQLKPLKNVYDDNNYYHGDVSLPHLITSPVESPIPIPLVDLELVDLFEVPENPEQATPILRPKKYVPPRRAKKIKNNNKTLIQLKRTFYLKRIQLANMEKKIVSIRVEN